MGPRPYRALTWRNAHKNFRFRFCEITITTTTTTKTTHTVCAPAPHRVTAFSWFVVWNFCFIGFQAVCFVSFRFVYAFSLGSFVANNWNRYTKRNGSFLQNGFVNIFRSGTLHTGHTGTPVSTSTSTAFHKNIRQEYSRAESQERAHTKTLRMSILYKAVVVELGRQSLIFSCSTHQLQPPPQLPPTFSTI